MRYSSIQSFTFGQAVRERRGGRPEPRRLVPATDEVEWLAGRSVRLPIGWRPRLGRCATGPARGIRDRVAVALGDMRLGHGGDGQGRRDLRATVELTARVRGRAERGDADGARTVRPADVAATDAGRAPTRPATEHQHHHRHRGQGDRATADQPAGSVHGSHDRADGSAGSFGRRPRSRAWWTPGSSVGPVLEPGGDDRVSDRAGAFMPVLPPPCRLDYRRRSPRAGHWWRDGAAT